MRRISRPCLQPGAPVRSDEGPWAAVHAQFRRGQSAAAGQAGFCLAADRGRIASSGWPRTWRTVGRAGMRRSLAASPVRDGKCRPDSVAWRTVGPSWRRLLRRTLLLASPRATWVDNHPNFRRLTEARSPQRMAKPSPGRPIAPSSERSNATHRLPFAGLAAISPSHSAIRACDCSACIGQVRCQITSADR